MMRSEGLPLRDDAARLAMLASLAMVVMKVWWLGEKRSSAITKADADVATRRCEALELEMPRALSNDRDHLSFLRLLRRETSVMWSEKF